MNSRQEAKLNMYRSVQLLCNNNLPLISGNLPFQTAFNSFSAKISAIISTASAESQVITGITTDKSVAKKNLCQNAADIAAIVFAYASANGNNLLKEQVDFSVSDLLKQKDDLLVPVCTNIYNAANDNIAPLTLYGITPALLTSLQTAMLDYSTSVPMPKTARSVKLTSGTNLKTLFTETDSLLKDQMDKLKNIFKQTDLNFVISYNNARVIIDPETNRQNPKLKAVVA